MRNQIGIDLHVRAEQGDVATVIHGHAFIDFNRVFRRDLQRAQRETIEQPGIEEQFACAFCRDRVGQPCVRYAGMRAPHLHLIEQRVELIEQAGTGSDISSIVTANHQLPSPRPGGLGLGVAVQTCPRCLDLPFALKHLTQQLAIQHGVARGDHQLAGIAANGVTRFLATRRRDQRAIEIIRLAPALAVTFVTFVKTVVENIARRT